jgi:hypothetical protein
LAVKLKREAVDGACLWDAAGKSASPFLYMPEQRGSVNSSFRAIGCVAPDFGRCGKGREKADFGWEWEGKRKSGCIELDATA